MVQARQPENIEGRWVLAAAPTGRLQATIGDGSDQCLYDFRFETGEGAILEVFEVDICELNSYTLTD